MTKTNVKLCEGFFLRDFWASQESCYKTPHRASVGQGGSSVVSLWLHSRNFSPVCVELTSLIPFCVGFLRGLRFPPTPVGLYMYDFWSDEKWSSVKGTPRLSQSRRFWLSLHRDSTFGWRGTSSPARPVLMTMRRSELCFFSTIWASELSAGSVAKRILVT